MGHFVIRVLLTLGVGVSLPSAAKISAGFLEHLDFDTDAAIAYCQTQADAFLACIINSESVELDTEELTTCFSNIPAAQENGTPCDMTRRAICPTLTCAGQQLPPECAGANENWYQCSLSYLILISPDSSGECPLQCSTFKESDTGRGNLVLGPSLMAGTPQQQGNPGDSGGTGGGADTGEDVPKNSVTSAASDESMSKVVCLVSTAVATLAVSWISAA